MENKNIIKELNNMKFVENADMGQYTSMKTGGKASLLVMPQNMEELKRLLKAINRSGREFMVIGNGSNLLVRDGGYDGIIIKLEEGFEEIKVSENSCIMEVGATASLAKVAREAQAAGLAGFEFASGIPGTMGGGLFMNAGAYDGELSGIVKEATLLSRDGEREYTLQREEMELGYRKSIFQITGDIIIRVTLQLEPGDKEAIAAKIQDFTTRRNEKQPMTFPSAGSFFKRPEGYFAGKLISDAGLRGLTLGGAQVSPLHAGFLINKGGATTTDVLQLMRLVQNTVQDKFGVMLEPEVRIIGKDPVEAEATRNPREDIIAKSPVEAAIRNYKMTFDYHTHTVFSHGTGSMEDNVKVAIKKGLRSIAITDHAPGHLTFGIKRKNIPVMRAEVERLQKLYPEIKILLGVEANMIHKGKGLDITEEEAKQFDYVLAGYHLGVLHGDMARNFLYSKLKKKFSKNHSTGTLNAFPLRGITERMMNKNTEMVIHALRENQIHVLTHPGAKGPFDLEKIARVCAERGTLMEISSWHKHLTTEEIRLVADSGVKFIISSDAHKPGRVGSMGTAVSRAQEAGLDLSRIVNLEVE